MTFIEIRVLFAQSVFARTTGRRRRRARSAARKAFTTLGLAADVASDAAIARALSARLKVGSSVARALRAQREATFIAQPQVIISKGHLAFLTLAPVMRQLREQSAQVLVLTFQFEHALLKEVRDPKRHVLRNVLGSTFGFHLSFSFR